MAPLPNGIRTSGGGTGGIRLSGGGTGGLTVAKPPPPPPPIPTLTWTSGVSSTVVSDWESLLVPSPTLSGFIGPGSTAYIVVDAAFSPASMAVPGATLAFSGFSATSWNSLNDWRPEVGVTDGGAFRRMDLVETPGTLWAAGSISDIDSFSGVITAGTLSYVAAPFLIIIQMRTPLPGSWSPGGGGSATNTWIALLDPATASLIGL